MSGHPYRAGPPAEHLRCHGRVQVHVPRAARRLGLVLRQSAIVARASVTPAVAGGWPPWWRRSRDASGSHPPAPDCWGVGAVDPWPGPGRSSPAPARAVGVSAEGAAELRCPADGTVGDRASDEAAYPGSVVGRNALTTISKGSVPGCGGDGFADPAGGEAGAADEAQDGAEGVGCGDSGEVQSGHRRLEGRREPWGAAVGASDGPP